MKLSVFSRTHAALLAALLSFWAPVWSLADETGDWPYWRGPAADGMAVGAPPLKWSESENVRWKADIPGLGHSSPIVWGDRVFVTTAIPAAAPAAAPTTPAPTPTAEQRPFGDAAPQPEHSFDVLCLDRKTGKLLWRQTATKATPHEGVHKTYGSYASNSPVTDGERVYVFFGSRGVYCYDMDGKPVWQKDFGVQLRIKMAFGEGMAPVLAGDRLVLVFDHEGESFITVLDKKTGEEVWRAPRDERTNWAAPLVVEHGGRKQVVVSATGKVRSYDLESGKVIWECSGLGANTIPAPVQQGDLVFVMSGYRQPNLMAIRLGREGDLTGSDAIVWSQTKGNAYTASPVIDDNKLYVLTDNGTVSCYNAQTGEPFYHQAELPKPYKFKASPVGADGRLYLASENGDVVVLRMGEQFEVLATNTMPDEAFIATPAVAGGDLFLRSKNRLYCIAEG